MTALTKVCDLEDFGSGPLHDTMREVFAHEIDRFGDGWPSGAEYRKHWEVAIAVLTLRQLGALHDRADVLGVGAGNEPTLYWLTRHVNRVFATDLYLGEGWAGSAAPAMFTDPGRFWPAQWDPQRLVVQHMDGRALHHPDGAFDAVFSSSSLEHFGTHEDIAHCIDELYRVLKRGGVLSLSTELRLAGPAPGLPGTLLFAPHELDELVIGRHPWSVQSRGSLTPSDATRGTEVPFDDAFADLRAHVAEHGAIYYHRLKWSRYPHIVQRHGDHVWTSVHLALRKPS